MPDQTLVTTVDSEALDGWLEPNGRFHEVGCEGHSWFASRRGTSQDALYKQGWVKLSGGEWYDDEDKVTMAVTQKQFDTIYAWTEGRGRTFNPSLYDIK